MVAIVMPDLDNPIFPLMAQLLTAGLAGADRTSLVARCGTAAEEPAVLERLASAGIGGLVLVSGAHADTTADMAREQMARVGQTSGGKAPEITRFGG